MSVMRSGPSEQKLNSLPMGVMKSGPQEKKKEVKEEIKEEKLEEVEDFICEVCGQGAKSRAGLAAHKRSHKNE